MRLLDEIMIANRNFLDQHKMESLSRVPKLPKRKVAIFTCMDTRLVELLEPAMGLCRGDAHVIKNAGNTIVDPTGAVIRSLVVSIYILGVEEILVVGHRDCGMAQVHIDDLEDAMLRRGVPLQAIAEVQGLRDWVGAFADPSENVRRVTDLIRESPLIPHDVPVHGLIVEPNRGALTVLSNGYAVSAS